MKPQPIRSQRPFQEHMQTLYQNIDNMTYAAEVSCNVSHDMGCICKRKEQDCAFKSKMFPEGQLYLCKLHSLRSLIGDHTPQHDIEIPTDNTYPPEA